MATGDAGRSDNRGANAPHPKCPSVGDHGPDDNTCCCLTETVEENRMSESLSRSSTAARGTTLPLGTVERFAPLDPRRPSLADEKKQAGHVEAVRRSNPGWVVATVSDGEGGSREVEVRTGSRFDDRPPLSPDAG